VTPIRRHWEGIEDVNVNRRGTRANGKDLGISSILLGSLIGDGGKGG